MVGGLAKKETGGEARFKFGSTSVPYRQWDRRIG